MKDKLVRTLKEDVGYFRVPQYLYEGTEENQTRCLGLDSNPAALEYGTVLVTLDRTFGRSGKRNYTEL